MELLTALAAVVSLSVPGRTNATPSVAADGVFVAVVWSASDTSGATDIFAAVSHDSGRTYGAPVRVNETLGEARTSGEQPPRIALTPRPQTTPAMTVVWTAKGSSGTKLVFSRSLDGGRSFNGSKTLAGSDAVGNRGWLDVAADRSGRVYTVWLDHREQANDSTMPARHHEHAAAGKPDGVAMAQKSKLYIESLDGAVAPHPVTGGVCYCCKTALAIDADGHIDAAWRHVFPGNLRDIAFSRSIDGGRTFAQPIRVSEDHWMLEGCPDDGPSLTVDTHRRVHVVWPTLVSEQTGGETIALFYARSRRNGTFGPRMPLPTQGTPHHPQIVLAPDGALVAAWDETLNGNRRAVVAWAGITSSGEPRFRRDVVSGHGSAVYPAIAVSGPAAVVAWTARSEEGSVIAVTTVTAPKAEQ